MNKWEKTLDTYNNIVTTLDKHSEKTRQAEEDKLDKIEDERQSLKWRLKQLANGTVSLGALSKEMIQNLQKSAKEGEETAFEAAHMKAVRNTDIIEAKKLSAVAADATLNKVECQACKGGAWKQHISFGILALTIAVWH